MMRTVAIIIGSSYEHIQSWPAGLKLLRIHTTAQDFLSRLLVVQRFTQLLTRLKMPAGFY